MIFDIPNISVVGVLVALGLWALKELVYDKSRRLNKKVDTEMCITKHISVDKKLDDIQDKVDDIYMFLLNKGEKK